ncbi:MAG TPA: YbhB/YbcL family Raf kinase inhibitor-like protein [Gemmatimonadales bacterium]|nr:YbhB/YbcL family Raf kinase inhibitor-like protein [Gemmatimonadales bacterium]
MPRSSAATADTVQVRAPDAPRHSAPITLTSTTFEPGGTLPDSMAADQCGGENRSPALSWSDFPSETRSFALTIFDPHAPTGSGFWHWVVFDLPASVTRLDAGVGSSASPGGGRTGHNDYGQSRYGGPCPPPGDGPHDYVFTVYALDLAKVDGAGPETTGAKLNFLMRGHVLAKGVVQGKYERR